MKTNKIVVQCKRGSYSIPKNVPQPVSQEKLWKEYWETPAKYVIKIWEGK